jgi:hypothetical protein
MASTSTDSDSREQGRHRPRLHPRARIHRTPDGMPEDFDGFSRRLPGRLGGRNPNHARRRRDTRHPGEWIHRRTHLQREKDEPGWLGKVGRWFWHGKVKKGDFTPQQIKGDGYVEGRIGGPKQLLADVLERHGPDHAAAVRDRGRDREDTGREPGHDDADIEAG